MLSSGVKNLLKLVATWAVAIAVTVFAVANFDEIRARFGLQLKPEDFGVAQREDDVAPAREPEVRTVVKYVEREPEAATDRRAPGRNARRRDEDLFRNIVSLDRGSDGHFRADASINGRSIGVLVDTGATLVAMSYEDAAAAGVSVAAGDFRYVSNTANGQARFARVTLEQVRIGSVVVRNVPAAVSEPGRLGVTLLGMSFLGQLRMEMKNGRLILEQ